MVRFEIGNEYESLAGGVLTVIEVLPAHVVVECSICSEDKELFPTPLKVTKHSIRIGKPSCGCHPKFSYTQEQQVVRVSKECTHQGLHFNCFQGDYKGIRTKLSLSCQKGHTWKTARVSTLLARKTGCYVCRNENMSLRMKHEWVGRVRKTSKGSVLTVIGEYSNPAPSLPKRTALLVTCSICSKDTELFPLPFSQHKSDWNSGKSPCGCGAYCNWNEEQYRVLCNRACDKLGDRTFKGFVGEWKGCDTKVALLCPHHGVWESSSIDKLIRKDARSCPDCSRESNSFGRYRSRDYELDTLYLLHFKGEDGEEFTKVGRTFDMIERLRPMKRVYDVTILSTYKTIHHHIYVLEMEIHRMLKEHKYTPIKFFGGSVRECFTYDILQVPIIKSLFKL